jgi:eukaryotic-like serine/threonine-protein kinase
MGVVYLAEAGSQRVAIKRIHPLALAQPGVATRFRREAEAIQLLDSPRVAGLVEDGSDHDLPFIALEYVEGPTLGDLVAEHGPLSPDQVESLALGVAEALRSIHAVRITHRDLKPSNLVCTPKGPVLIDFGIAALADATALTQTGMALGSIGWMAPEQIRGHDALPSADMFSWGSCVAFAATGRPPFGHGRMEVVANRVLTQEPEVPPLPEPLGSLVVAALSKDAHTRPSAESIIASLTGATSFLPEAVTAQISATWQLPANPQPAQPADAVRERTLGARGRMALVLGMVLAALGGGGALLWTDILDGLHTDTAASRTDEIAPSPSEGATSMPAQSTSGTTADTAGAASTTTSTEPPAPQPVRLPSVPWHNRSYVIGCDDSWSEVTLINGNAQGPGEFDPFYEIQGVLYYDITGDGADEAIVSIACLGAVGGMPNQVQVFAATPQGPQQIGETLIGYPYDAGDGFVAGREPVYAPEDPRCCPSGHLLFNWEWSAAAGRFERVDGIVVAEPPEGRLL